MNPATPTAVIVFFFSAVFYSFLNQAGRRVFLLTASFLWYASWVYWWPVFLLLVLFINYALLQWHREKNRLFNVTGWLIGFDAVLFFAVKILDATSHRPFPTPFGFGLFILLLIGFLADIKRTVAPPSESFIDFASFCLFFPLLLSGPIERNSQLGPQLKQPRAPTKDDRRDGALIFIWGFFKKIVLADSLWKIMEPFLSSHHPGLTDLVGFGVLSTFWVYYDLSSYCDMGRGLARCFGIQLSVNFRPFYYSRDPHDFWQRWNITLGTWIRDYITLPAILTFGRNVNRLIIIIGAFFLLGVWHGVSLNWILFGICNGLCVVVFLALRGRWQVKAGRRLAASGLVLVMILYVSNGVLQSVNTAQLADMWQALTFQNGWGNVHRVGSVGLEALPYLLIGLAFDFFQELRGNIDFFLDLSVWKRWFLGLILSSSALIFVLERGPRGIPPIYFKF